MPEDLLLSPEESLYQQIIQRVTEKVPEVRYIDLDLGQLENYELRPPVSWPCLLIDLDESRYSDTGNKLYQVVELAITFRIGLVKYTDSNNLTPTNIRPNALKYFRLENKLFMALHGWEPEGFGPLTRFGAGTEKRDDDIRVRVVRYQLCYTDMTAAPQSTKVARPTPTINKG
ncbi:hypothetical protein F0L74_05990 [Chitinophaga agrisoli]|uniref:Gp37 protein n=1 Tax=Chitinophaga agrisoli TaxID=2607653 RepID=A0A5B2W555_9BACT|nr:hypothetical protein [Chitinophaga agrisoli]KAA2245507.1 hypothetical protein F0L74_05990 [Chitinophaga agrisoli]